MYGKLEKMELHWKKILKKLGFDSTYDIPIIMKLQVSRIQSFIPSFKTLFNREKKFKLLFLAKLSISKPPFYLYVYCLE